MKRDDVLNLILQEMQGIRADLKEVRQTDIPKINEKIAIVEERSKNSAKVITAAGGLIAVATSAAIAWFKS